MQTGIPMRFMGGAIQSDAALRQSIEPRQMAAATLSDGATRVAPRAGVGAMGPLQSVPRRPMTLRQHAGEWGALICAGHHLETFPDDAPIKKQSDIRFATPGAIASRQRPRPVGESKGLRRSSWQAGRAPVTDLGERNATDRPADRITAAMDPFNQDPVVR